MEGRGGGVVGVINLIKGGVKINVGGGWNFNKSVNIGNEWKNRHECLILVLNLKVSKQTRSEASKNKVIIKRVSNKSINWVNRSK